MYPHVTRHPLTLPADVVLPTPGPDGEYPPPPPPTASGYEISAEADRSGSPGERPGLSVNEARLECQVVRSPGALPLRVPLKAGDAFPLTLLGKTGRATVLPLPDPQHPTEARLLGQMFYAQWASNG